MYSIYGFNLAPNARSTISSKPIKDSNPKFKHAEKNSKNHLCNETGILHDKQLAQSCRPPSLKGNGRFRMFRLSPLRILWRKVGRNHPRLFVFCVRRGGE